MQKLLIFLSLFSIAHSYYLDRLSNLQNKYLVGKNSRVFFISAEQQKVLDTVQLVTQNGNDNSNGTYLSITTPTGSLTPMTPSQDNDTLLVFVPANLTGFLYITEDPNINVYPLSQNSSAINFQPGTNVFFNLKLPPLGSVQQIPIANNVVINAAVSFRGLAGVPEQIGMVFFDAANFSGLTNYNSLQLASEVFHFQTNGVDVQYEISYGYRVGILVNDAGLLMTRDFPNADDPMVTSSVRDYEIGNFNGDNITLYLMCRFNPTFFYTTNITLYNLDKTLQTSFVLNSTTDTFIKLASVFERLTIEGAAPYSIQYQVFDPYATTVKYETSTKSGSFVDFFVSLSLVVLAGILNF